MSILPFDCYYKDLAHLPPDERNAMISTILTRSMSSAMPIILRGSGKVWMLRCRSMISSAIDAPMTS